MDKGRKFRQSYETFSVDSRPMDVQILWVVRSFVPDDGRVRRSRTSASDCAAGPAFNTTGN
jgi:hypothetical protein